MIATFRPLSPRKFPLSGKIGPDLSRFPGTDSRASSAFRDLSPRLRPLSENLFPRCARFPHLFSRDLSAFRELRKVAESDFPGSSNSFGA